MRRIVLAILLAGPVLGWAQCAMCRKNAEAAAPGLAKGLRIGIVMLFVAPYAAAGLVGWLWYRRMKARERIQLSSGDGGSELPSRDP